MATVAEAPASAQGLVSHTPFQFSPAEKEARPVRGLIDGPPGSGRTLTALRMASALGDKIAVIDTERGKSRHYADQVAHQVTEMTTFHPLDLCLALYAAADYDVVIIDCWSAFWNGPEGVRDQVAQKSARRGVSVGNKDAAWNEVRPVERQALDAVLSFPGHLIATLRNRVEVVLTTDTAGRTVPTRFGTWAEQRDGLEYDVDFAASLLPTHELIVTKSSAPSLADGDFTDAVDAGAQLRQWAERGVDRAPRAEFLHRAYDGTATYESLSELAREIQVCRAAGMAAVDHRGRPVMLGDLVSYRLSKARSREQAQDQQQAGA
ncbi:AAA family ATPase [Streptomyces lasiicapitis]|uniref:AAA family ATPase n=1 Tax=Streptomyces lasiicapitis TaxID=1923961 RepID=UPI00332798A0